MNKIFYEKLKEILKERNSNFSQLAKDTGIQQATISTWRRKTPGIDKLIIICQYLNVSADDLLELEPKPPDRLTPEEKILIEYYQSADQEGKKMIYQIAKREASRGQPPDEEKELSVSKIG